MGSSYASRVVHVSKISISMYAVHQISIVRAHAGQFEIATGHYPLMEAADKLLVIREVICGVARKHGMEVGMH